MKKMLLVIGLVLISSGAFAADVAPKLSEKEQSLTNQVTNLNAQVAKLSAQMGVYKELLTEANDRLVANAALAKQIK